MKFTPESNVDEPPYEVGKMKFCPCCTQELRYNNEQNIQRYACPNEECDYVRWDSPTGTAAALIPFPMRFVGKEPEGPFEFDLTHEYADFSQTGIPLVRRGIPPYIDEWCLPCGHVNFRCTPEATAVSESEEESGLIVAPEELLYSANPIPGKLNTLVNIYKCRPVGGRLIAGDDAKEVQIFGINDIPKIPFSSHQAQVERWFRGEISRLTGIDFRP